MTTRVTEVSFNKMFGGVPRDILYEDEQCVVFDEVQNPQAPVHFLVVPRWALPRLSEASEHDEKRLGHLLLTAHKQALQRGLPRGGYHAMLDEDWRAGRLNAVHVFGRALGHMAWPTGPGAKL